MYKAIPSRIWCFHLGLAIWVDNHVAFPVFLRYYIAKALTQNSKPTLKATYHSGKQIEGPTMNKETTG